MKRNWFALGTVYFASLSLLVGLLWLLGVSPISADLNSGDELFVCKTGCDYSTLQEAVDAANPGDTIKMATGIYTGVHSRNGVTQMAFITQALTIQGGFSPDFNIWDPVVYSTTLDAQGQGRVLYANGAFSLTLEGLRLINGYKNTTGGGAYVQGVDLELVNSWIEQNHTAYGDGAGVYLLDGSLAMTNCVVQQNQPSYSDDSFHSGGGMYLKNSEVEIYNSSILSNTASYCGWSGLGRGGGVFLENSAALIQYTTFRNNVACVGDSGRGGGLSTVGGTLSLLDSTFDRNTAAEWDGGAGGGAYVRTDFALISGNVFTGNFTSKIGHPTGSGGGIDIGNSWENSSSCWGVTLTHNLIQNNTGNAGGGLCAYNMTVVNVEENQMIGNHGGGMFLMAKSDSGTPSRVMVRRNLFQDNNIGGNGGGALVYGAADIYFNQFIDNHAGGNGGGVYQGENSRFDNASSAYNGNLFRGNTAASGGGMYIYTVFSEQLAIRYTNLALLDNQATGTGSGIYFHKYANSPVAFNHLTLSNNTGGDNAMVYVVMGKVQFNNTILHDGIIGIKKNSGTVSLDHTLRDGVITPTLALWGSIPDLDPITGSVAFAADTYHLTRYSAAVDAGVDLGVIDDIDGEPRPRGTAPDVGADESAYSLADSGMQAAKLAGTPHWKVYYTGINVPPSTILEQDYMIPYAYNTANSSVQVTSFTIRDDFPENLELEETSSHPELEFSQDDSTLSWNSTQPLKSGEWGWIGLTGRSKTILAGEEISNTGRLDYSLSNGNSFSITLQAGSQVPPRPVYPPLLIAPLDGEMCLDEGNQLSASGLAGADMTVKLYEDGSYKAETIASASGEFSMTWTTSLEPNGSIEVYTLACEPGGNCSEPSRAVHLDYPLADWCPQRSYWDGYVNGIHHIFYFRNDLGRYASNDFVLPGVYGFWNTQVHLFSCCDHNDTNPFKVTADDVVYLTPSSHDGRWWTFNIGSAHNIIVESQCQGGGTPPPPKSTHGQVLIDPDGYVFDSSLGGGYDPLTGVFSPVQSIAGVTVTAYMSVPEWGGWIPWPAHLYNDQINPQVTGDNGYFAFFTPPGTYRLQADTTDGYQSWRSPVIEVITQIVHVNIPYTPLPAGYCQEIQLTPGGMDKDQVSLSPGGCIAWSSMLDESSTADDLTEYSVNPILRPLSELNPLTDIRGWDGGLLTPGEVYRRVFDTPGEYSYTDGAGNNGLVIVSSFTNYLPLVMRQ